MRKYLKPAMEMDAFDLRDILTASDGGDDFTEDPDNPENEASAPDFAIAPGVIDFN